MKPITVRPDTKTTYGCDWNYDMDGNLTVSPLFAKIYNHLLKEFQKNNFAPLTLRWKDPVTNVVITPILKGAHGKEEPNSLSDVVYFVYSVTPTVSKTAYTLIALTQALTQFQALYQLTTKKEKELETYIKSADKDAIRYAQRFCNFYQVPIQDVAVTDFYHFMLIPPEKAVFEYPDNRSHEEAVNTLPALITFLEKQELYEDLYNQRLSDVLAI